MIALSSANSCKNITGAYTPDIMLTVCVVPAICLLQQARFAEGACSDKSLNVMLSYSSGLHCRQYNQC
jgi:hypothetical protein